MVRFQYVALTNYIVAYAQELLDHWAVYFVIKDQGEVVLRARVS